jgi:hypothetical protein
MPSQIFREHRDLGRQSAAPVVSRRGSSVIRIVIIAAAVVANFS